MNVLLGYGCRKWKHIILSKSFGIESVTNTKAANGKYMPNMCFHSVSLLGKKWCVLHKTPPLTASTSNNLRSSLVKMVRKLYICVQDNLVGVRKQCTRPMIFFKSQRRYRPVLPVDASNTFHSLNRETMLHTTSVTYMLAKYIHNCPICSKPRSPIFNRRPRPPRNQEEKKL